MVKVLGNLLKYFPIFELILNYQVIISIHCKSKRLNRRIRDLVSIAIYQNKLAL